MDDAEELDDVLRAELRAAAELESAPFVGDEALYAKLHAALLHEQPRARRRRRFVRASAALTMAAAAAVLLLWWRAPESQPASLAATATQCALPTMVAITPGDADKLRISLGRFGELVAAPGTRLAVESAEPCLLSLKLEQGELAGDLTNLKPARLRVRTAHGAVIVRGTRFSVRANGGLEVVLLSGRVEIEEETTRVLEPAHVYRRTGKERQVLAIQRENSEHIARLLARAPADARGASKAGPVASDAAAVGTQRAQRPSSSSLLARAEAERRQGRTKQARALYREASAGVDDDAEVALLRWVRLELSERAFPAAEQLLTRHAQRFALGKLRAEAMWLRVVSLKERGREAEAKQAARALVLRFPSTPQAEAAEALVAAL